MLMLCLKGRRINVNAVGCGKGTNVNDCSLGRKVDEYTLVGVNCVKAHADELTGVILRPHFLLHLQD